MARGAPPIGLRPRRMTPSMSNAMPKDGLSGAAAEWEKRWARSDGRWRCAVWSSARDRDRAARTSAERKPLMPRRSALQVRLYGLRLPSEPEASGSAAGRVLRLVFYCG